jgi:hypothetical protein
MGSYCPSKGDNAEVWIGFSEAYKGEIRNTSSTPVDDVNYRAKNRLHADLCLSPTFDFTVLPDLPSAGS